ncbi:MAG TPA: DUF1579 family protein [Phycisphaerales bacterium]|nr:DUF1579 family protein [Phycisphaerales bacterium]
MDMSSRPLAILAVIMLCVLPACRSGGGSGEPERSAPTPSVPPGTAGTPNKEVQAAYEPRSGPGEGQDFLRQMAGEWDVVKTFYPRGGGEPGVTRGTCTQKMIQEGRFLESDFTFHDVNGDTTGTGIIGYDPQTKKFTSIWIDSRSTRFSARASDEPFDGTQITLVGKSIGEPGPSARQSRTISVLQDGGRTLLHRQWSVSADGNDRLVMQMVMTRR